MKIHLKPRTSMLLITGLALACLCLLLIEPGPVRADTITVNTTVDEADGDCDLSDDCSLRDAIALAYSDDLIDFDASLSGETIVLDSELAIGKNLTIDGSTLPSHVQISGNNAVRVFSVGAGVTVALRHLDIINGHADPGGGGGIANVGYLTVTGCNLSGNTTPHNGGGIYNGGTLTVDGGSLLSGNSAGYGGGIRNDNGTLVVSDSTLSDNTADFGGGIDNYFGTAALDNTNLERNMAVSYGGGITSSAPLTVDYCTFTDNLAVSGGGIDNHGSEADLTVSDSTFTGNTAKANGGALLNDEATVEVNNSTFDSNSATVAGGGIYNGASGSVTINDTTLFRNSAAWGSGISNTGTVTANRCAFDENTATGNGGGILNEFGGTLTVNDTTFRGNIGSYGGGIRNQSTLAVTGSTFDSNTADFGGGIDNYAGSMALDNVTFERNTANHYGGGIITGVTATIEDSSFTENLGERGGGIDSHEAGATLTLTRCTFTANTVSRNGGALFNDAATVGVNDSSFENNAADSGGGGIFNDNAGTMTLTDSTLIGNTASGEDTGWGGGIFNYGVLTLHGGSLTDNTAHLHGGGIWNWEGELTVDGATFETNSAEDTGGAIVNNWSSDMTVTDSAFRENSAKAGGGIFNDNDSSAVVNNSTFEINNATDTTGGGIENRKGTLTAGNCTFSGNTSASAGGGIDNTEGSFTLTNCTFMGNSAIAVGGGIFNGTLGTLNYRDTIVASSASGEDCISDGAIGENINNLVEDDTCDPMLAVDPQLGSLQDNGGPTETHVLLPDSPAIDAGDAATCLAADQRGEARDDWACDIGAFELKFADSDYVTKAVTGAGTYTFGPTKVRVEVSSQGDLDSLTVRKTVGDHPGRTGSGGGGGVGWGEYFTLDPNADANGTFQANLTLPALFVPEASDTVCRYVSGTTWDCAANSFSPAPFNIITRNDVTAFSDWAAGNNVSPTAVTLRGFRARGEGGWLTYALPAVAIGLGMLLALAMCGGGSVRVR